MKAIIKTHHGRKARHGSGVGTRHTACIEKPAKVEAFFPEPTEKHFHKLGDKPAEENSGKCLLLWEWGLGRDHFGWIKVEIDFQLVL